MSGNDERRRIRIRGEVWSHTDRAAKAIDMITDGASDDDIVYFFSTFSDFDEEETRRQIGIIRKVQGTKLR